MNTSIPICELGSKSITSLVMNKNPFLDFDPSLAPIEDELDPAPLPPEVQWELDQLRGEYEANEEARLKWHALQLKTSMKCRKMTQEKLAAEIDRSQGLVWQWVNAKTPIPAERAVDVARALNEPDPGKFSYQYKTMFSEIKGRPIRAYQVKSSEDGLAEGDIQLPVFDVLVSAGNGTLMPDFVETKYFQTYRQEWFDKEGVKPAEVRVMMVHGDSMNPLLYDGDKVTIALKKTRITNGGVYVILVGDAGDEARVKRLFKQADGRVRIVSDNPDKDLYPDEYMDAGMVIVLGRVIDKSGKGGL